MWASLSDQDLKLGVVAFGAENTNPPVRSALFGTEHHPVLASLNLFYFSHGLMGPKGESLNMDMLGVV